MKSSFNVHRIVTLDLPALHPYRTLRRPLEHIKEGIFVAEGEKVVRRLLSSNLTVISLLMTPEWYTELFPAEEHLGNSHLISHSPNPISQTTVPTIFLADKQLLETIVGYNLHQGIMAMARVPEQKVSRDILQGISPPYLLVALDGLVSAENVGVVVRNCAAFGADAIIVGETSSSPYLRRAVRNSMGAVFQLPVAHAENLADTLHGFHRTHMMDIVAADPHEQSAIHQTSFNGNVCIVFGNEGEGISEHTLKVCTRRVAIPMMNHTDSLNVASASAVFLYEIRRQRENLVKVTAGKTEAK